MSQSKYKEGRKGERRKGGMERRRNRSKESKRGKKREITPNFGRHGGRIQRHFKTALTSHVIEGNLSQSSFSLFESKNFG